MRSWPKKQCTTTSYLCLHLVLSPVGIILDQAGRCAGAGHPRRDVTADAVNAARKIAGTAAAGVLPKGG